MLTWLVLAAASASLQAQPASEPAGPREPWLFASADGIWLVVPQAWMAGADSVHLTLLEQRRDGLGFSEGDRCPYGASSGRTSPRDTSLVTSADDRLLLLCGMGSGDSRAVPLSAIRYTPEGIRRVVVRAAPALLPDSAAGGVTFAGIAPLLGAIVGAVLTYAITSAQRRADTKQKQIALAREVWTTIDRDLQVALQRLATFLHRPGNVPQPLPENPWTVLQGRSELRKYLEQDRGREYVQRLLRFYDDGFVDFQNRTRECHRLRGDERTVCLAQLVEPAKEMEQALRRILADQKE